MPIKWLSCILIAHLSLFTIRTTCILHEQRVHVCAKPVFNQQIRGSCCSEFTGYCTLLSIAKTLAVLAQRLVSQLHATSFKSPRVAGD